MVEEKPKEQKDDECNCKKKQLIPLLEYLCQQHHCSIEELHVLLQNLETRRAIIKHLRHNVRLRTNHIRPLWRNFMVRCNDLSAQSADTAFAMGGYLGITVDFFGDKTSQLNNSGPGLLFAEAWGQAHTSPVAVCDRIWRWKASLIVPNGMPLRYSAIIFFIYYAKYCHFLI